MKELRYAAQKLYEIATEAGEHPRRDEIIRAAGRIISLLHRETDLATSEYISLYSDLDYIETYASRVDALDFPTTQTTFEDWAEIYQRILSLYASMQEG